MQGKQKILVVEDDEHYQTLYYKILRPHFNLCISSTEQSRSELNNKISAIVTNCYVRKRNRLITDGFSLLRFARSQGCYAPFVLLAEARDRYINWEGDTYGVFDILQKRRPDFYSRLIDSLNVAIEFSEYQSQRNKRDRAIFDTLSRIPNVIPISWDYSDEDLYSTFFEIDNKLNRFCYANNWMYICQAARQNGHKFFDGKVLITIEAYKKERGGYQFEIIRPLGQNAAKKAFQLAEQLKGFTKYPIVFKRLEPDQVNSLLKRGCDIMEKTDSKKLVDLYDDIYPQIVIDLKGFLHSLNLPQMAWFRRGLRQFTKRSYTIRDLKPHLYKDVREVILRWKRSFITRYKNKEEFIAIPEHDSYYLDPYLPFVEYFGRTNERHDIIATIFYVYEKPVGFSVLAQVSDVCMAMYANVGDTDYKGLSYFMLYQNFLRALWSGYSYVNLGGTESKSLFDFYVKLAGLSSPQEQSISISWSDLNLHDIDEELTHFKEAMKKKKEAGLNEQLSKLNIATLLERIAAKQKKLRVLHNSIPENQVLERKYLVYPGKKYEKDKSSNSRVI